jgi:hypothetical protein
MVRNASVPPQQLLLHHSPPTRPACGRGLAILGHTSTVSHNFGSEHRESRAAIRKPCVVVAGHFCAPTFVRVAAWGEVRRLIVAPHGVEGHVLFPCQVCWRKSYHAFRGFVFRRESQHAVAT